jgi:hypothetical protein
MSGATSDDGEPVGLRYSVTLTGLAPGEVVSLYAAANYDVHWICGTQPEPCGEVGCAPAFGETTEGTATSSVNAVAASDGKVTVEIDLVASPPAETCPADATAPWRAMAQTWREIQVTDDVHGLRLTPEPIHWADTI